MTVFPETYFADDFRGARAGFLAAAAHSDAGVTTRVHPSARGPDGKPLLMDSIALGPRAGDRPQLLRACDLFGAGILTGLLCQNIGARLPEGARLVMVHACDPVRFACGRTGDTWPRVALRDLAAEDLRRVTALRLVDLRSGHGEAHVRRRSAKSDLAVLLPQVRQSAAILTGGTGNRNWKTRLFDPAARLVEAELAAL
jgi:hypothetical protein